LHTVIWYFWWKDAIYCRSQVQIDEWNESVKIPGFSSKIHNFPFAQYNPPSLKEIPNFILIFTRLNSYTVNFSQYRAFLKRFILYYSLQIARLHVILFHCIYDDSRKAMNWNIQFILQFLNILLTFFVRSSYVRGKYFVMHFVFYYIHYTNFPHKDLFTYQPVVVARHNIPYFLNCWRPISEQNFTYNFRIDKWNNNRI
jgi:hypothetical protein